MSVPKDLIKQIENSENILIQAHPKPDGDALGSAIALGRGLKSLGKKVDYYIDTTYEPKLNYLKEIENFNQPLDDHYDSLIIVDCSTAEYSCWPNNKPSYDKLISIDHHKSNEKFGDLNYVEVTGAAGELVYNLLESLDVELDDEIREALFTSLSSDTGSFQFSNTTSQTHKIASKLYEGGQNFAPISKRLHNQKTIQQLNMLKGALDHIKLFNNGEIVFIELPYEVIQENGGIENITDDLANIGMNLDTSKVSVLIKEYEPNVQKISLRSKSPYNIDVSEIAVKYNGGGHYRAAGATYNGSIQELEEKLLDDLNNVIS